MDIQSAIRARYHHCDAIATHIESLVRKHEHELLAALDPGELIAIRVDDVLHCPHAGIERVLDLQRLHTIAQSWSDTHAATMEAIHLELSDGRLAVHVQFA